MLAVSTAIKANKGGRDEVCNPVPNVLRLQENHGKSGFCILHFDD